MAFVKKTWLPRTGVGLNKFRVGDLGIKELASTPDSVTQEGDALSAANMNDLERRIDEGTIQGVKVNSGTEISPSAGVVDIPLPMEKAFTYVIDSQDKFNAWVNNTAGNDYSYVAIIGKGSAYTTTTTINLTTTGTKGIQGFNGATISVTVANYNYVLKYEVLSKNTYIKDLTVMLDYTNNNWVYAFGYCNNLTNCSVIIKSLPSTATAVTCFYVCENLINCRAENLLATEFPKPYCVSFSNCKYLLNCSCKRYSGNNSSNYGFSYCSYLNNCYAYLNVEGALGSNNYNASGFYYCNYIGGCYSEIVVSQNTASLYSGQPYGYGYMGCKFLTNCDAKVDVYADTAVGSKGYSTGYSVCYNIENCSAQTLTTPDVKQTYIEHAGFKGCYAVSRCKASGRNYGTVFSNCFASNSSTSTYAVADTANGGFNNTTDIT